MIDTAALLDLTRLTRMLAEHVVALEQRSPTWDTLPPDVVTQLERLEQLLAREAREPSPLAELRIETPEARRVDIDELAAQAPAVCRTPSPRERAKQAATDHAAAWLGEQLAAGPAAASDIRRRAERAGLSERQIRRAKRDLTIEGQPHGFRGTWYWRLPQKDAQCGTQLDRGGRTR